MLCGIAGESSCEPEARRAERRKSIDAAAARSGPAIRI
jgi:hypothetical protein